MVLKTLILDGTLSSSFFFPFITSLSQSASTSQIQTTSASLNNGAWNSFRKLSFLESADFFPELAEEIEALPSDSHDRNVRAFAALWKVLLSDNCSELLE